MKELIKEFEETVAEVEMIGGAALCSEGFVDLDMNQLAAVQKVFKLIKVAKELTIKQAETINSMNEKLDKILEHIDD